MTFDGQFEQFMNAVSEHPRLRYLNMAHAKIRYQQDQAHLMKLEEILFATLSGLQYFYITD